MLLLLNWREDDVKYHLFLLVNSLLEENDPYSRITDLNHFINKNI